jgi:hypothetical protein
LDINNQQEHEMALQLGALRDALLDAGVTKEKAEAAAEEVAGYENRLTRLTTMAQAAIAILVVLLGSQAALWNEIGKMDGRITTQFSKLDAQLARIEAKIDGKGP